MPRIIRINNRIYGIYVLKFPIFFWQFFAKINAIVDVIQLLIVYIKILSCKNLFRLEVLRIVCGRVVPVYAMKTLLLFLLCLLLWSLVEVHSQTEFPYVSFRGVSLTNHSYVDFTLVGDPSLDDDERSVQCHTDLNPCCSGSQGPHRGDWYFPNRTRLHFPEQGNIYQARGAQRVELRRRNNANSPSGIYRCDIPTDSVHDETDISVRETVYVGVYAIGGIINI